MEEMQPVQTGLSVIDGSGEWYPQVQQICDLRFGSGYLTPEEYAKWMGEPRLLKIALMDGHFAGFAVMLPAAEAEVREHMDMPETDIQRITEGKPALIYKSAAVCHAYEHRGIMKRMAEEGLKTAQGLGYGALFASAWMYQGKIPIEGTFRAFGFQPLYQRHMLWYKDENYRCVVCKGRCTCDAMIYYKKL